MAQILALHRPAEARSRTVEPVREADARDELNREKAEAMAIFDRLMGFHAETQRKMAEFMRQCDQATQERRSAEVVILPVAHALSGAGPRCA